MAEVLALIPARGGSKGIPRKNVRVIAGQPLIAYSIQQAHASRLVTRTIVTTDDEEIADVARTYGAEVPFMRPAEFATDLATDLDVFKHVLSELSSREGYAPDLILHLRPTGPLREVSVIDAALQQMVEHSEADSLKTVSEAPISPYKMWKIDGGQLRPLLEIPGLPEAHSMPRQVLPTTYTGNGYLDIVRPRTVLEQNSMVGRVILPFIVHGRTHDLDYPEQIPDLEVALLEQRARHAAFAASHLAHTGTGDL
ncbi:MAG: hypothetical protein RJA70_3912 [Pseudomonadota bacterium]|jgi:N-acylneuraminate cytidylyltransferase